MVSEEDKNGKREVPRGLLDIFVEDLTPGAAQGRGIDVNQGALVNGIGEGSAAAFTDVLLFDVILEVNGDRVKSAADLRAKINAPPLEKEINLVLMRSSKRIETTLPSGQIEVVTSRKRERPLGMKLYLAEEDFRDGDPFAVDECVLVCHEDGAAVPDWVVEELAQRSRINLGIDEAPSKKGGRHSNPSAKQNDSLRRKRICCAVLAARKRGIAREKSYDTAQELLAKGLDLNHPRESIKKTFLNHGSKYNPESIWVLWFDNALEHLEAFKDDPIAEEIIRNSLKSLMGKKPL